MLGNLADSYLKTREYAIALRYAQQALPLAREVRHVKAEGVAQGNAGLALIALDRVDEGRRMLEEVIAASRRREEWPAVAQYEKELGQALESAGDSRGAVEAYHRARRVADDIWRREQQQRWSSCRRATTTSAASATCRRWTPTTA
jgi:tetratricopeptide (TPR) repeat protein